MVGGKGGELGWEEEKGNGIKLGRGDGGRRGRGVGDRIVLDEGRIVPGGEGYQGEGEGSWRKRGSGEEG